MKATFCWLLMVGGLLWGCDLNVANPNQAFEEQVLTTSDGIKALAIGMQRSYASNNVDAYVRHPAITSRELAANTTFSNLIELEDGLACPNRSSNSGVSSIWSNSYRIMGMANDLIANAPEVPLAEGTRSGIVALAHLYKAKCLGFVAQAFAHAPLDVQADGQAHNLGRVKSFSPQQFARWTAPSKLPLPHRHPTNSTRTYWARVLICSTPYAPIERATTYLPAIIKRRLRTPMPSIRRRPRSICTTRKTRTPCTHRSSWRTTTPRATTLV